MKKFSVSNIDWKIAFLAAVFTCVLFAYKNLADKKALEKKEADKLCIEKWETFIKSSLFCGSCA